MAKIMNEKNEAVYSGSIVKRLLSYAKPYIKQLVLSIILVMLITVFELVKPILIGDAIDIYIEGYNTPYGVVEESDLYFEGQYLSKDTENATSFSQLVLFEEEYYYFTNLTKEQSNTLYEMTQETFDATSLSVNNDTVKLFVGDFVGTKVNKDQLKVLRKDDINGMIKTGIIYVIVLILNLILLSF